MISMIVNYDNIILCLIDYKIRLLFLSAILTKIFKNLFRNYQIVNVK